MNIMKILRGYLAFILVISAMSLLSYNDSVRYYLADVFAADEAAMAIKPYSVVNSARAFVPRIPLNYVSEKRNGAVFNFEIVSSADGGFAEPGSVGATIMELNLKTGDQPLKLDGLKLKIEGVALSMILGADLLVDGEVLVSGRVGGRHMSFNDIGYMLPAAAQGNIAVALDLSPELKTGQRFRLNIEKPEDLKLTVGGRPYKVGSYYPLEGKYLSIARPRP